MSSLQFPNGVACITCDDSWASQFELMAPLLADYGFTATAFPILDVLGGTARMTMAQLRTLQDGYGWEIGAHANTDADHTATYAGITSAQLDADLAAMRATLQANGFRSVGCAYPLGVVAANWAASAEPVLSVVRKHYGYARTTFSKTKETFPVADPYRVRALSSISTYTGTPWTPANLTTATTGEIDKAVANKSMLNLVFHRIIPTVTSVTMSGNTGTVVFAGNHPFSVGQSLLFAGFTPAGLNGTWTVASGSPGTTTLTVTTTGSPTSSTVQGTILAATTDLAYSDFSAIIAKLSTSGIAVRTMGSVVLDR